MIVNTPEFARMQLRRWADDVKLLRELYAEEMSFPTVFAVDVAAATEILPRAATLGIESEIHTTLTGEN